MYQSHWGLQDAPFRSPLASVYYYQSPTHEEGMARLHFLVEQRRRLGLMLGPRGSGKSLLLRLFGDDLVQVGEAVVRRGLIGVASEELLRSLADGWGKHVEQSCSISQLWQTVTDAIVEMRYQRIGAVLLLDDADQAPPETLTTISRLCQTDLVPESTLTIILTSQTRGVVGLGDGLLEMADLRVDLEPWEVDDTAGFLNLAIYEAGRREPIFDDAAIERLHELAEGIPRRVSQLAELALLAGAGRELAYVDAATVDSVFYELGTVEV